MKFCTTCRRRFSNTSYRFCPADRTPLFEVEEREPPGRDAEGDSLVFEPAADPVPSEGEGFEPDSRTGSWFAEGEHAERELASATPSRPLPEIYFRALEQETDRPSRLRHVPWVVGAGITGLTAVILALL